ncbi:MAG TPA: multidrug efflux SMR transporter [Candidatus Fusicatenibacter intestinipullorum]|nr:multidrug efflux SMR transporter [Candidatus Fusicatenibacter intestinipullorum]
MKHVYMLFAAIALEVTGTTFMKFSVMHEWLIGYPVMLAAMACSYFCLSKAVKKIPISVAYAVWEGLGLAGTALMAWLIFNESMPPQKLFAFAIILIGLTMVKNGTARTGSE